MDGGLPVGRQVFDELRSPGIGIRVAADVQRLGRHLIIPKLGADGVASRNSILPFVP